MEQLVNIKKIIQSVAPFIGTLIGGPFTGIATTILGEIFCNDEKASLLEIEKAVSKASPEQFIRLREISAQKEKDFLEVGLNLEKIAALDRDSARDMQKVTRSFVPAFLSITALLGFLATIAASIYFPIPDDSQEAVGILIGTLGTLTGMGFKFWFGSTFELKAKIIPAK
jgi:hypothetical protein